MAEKVASRRANQKKNARATPYALNDFGNVLPGTKITLAEALESMKITSNRSNIFIARTNAFKIIELELLSFIDLITFLTEVDVPNLGPALALLRPNVMEKYTNIEDLRAYMEKSAHEPLFQEKKQLFVKHFGSDDFFRLKAEEKNLQQDVLRKLGKNGRKYLYYLLLREDIQTTEGYAVYEWEKPTEYEMAIIDQLFGPQVHHNEPVAYKLLVEDLKKRLMLVSFYYAICF